MRRRDFIRFIGSAAAALPVAARAQQPVVPVIGWLDSTAPMDRNNLADFRKGLTETGYVEGRNAATEFRAAERYDQLPALAAGLVRRQVAVMVASGLPAAVAAKAATTAIPIVFFTGSDPVRAGLVTSLSRPTGNLTGVTNLNPDLLLKRLELLRELAPTAGLIAVLVNPDNPNAEARLNLLEDAVRAIGQKISILNASRQDDFAMAFAAAVQQRAAALLIIDDPFFGRRSEQLAALAMSYAIPTASFSRGFVTAGGLIGYAATPGQTYLQIGTYVGRILNGEKPVDLPVVQTTRFTLMINLKTAKTLGVTIPPNLLAIADEVIE